MLVDILVCCQHVKPEYRSVKIKFFGRARPLCGGPVRRESGRLLPADEGVRREGFLMAQWGLAKNGRTTPRPHNTAFVCPHSRPPAEQCHLGAENAAERPFFGMRP